MRRICGLCPQRRPCPLLPTNNPDAQIKSTGYKPAHTLGALYRANRPVSRITGSAGRENQPLMESGIDHGRNSAFSAPGMHCMAGVSHRRLTTSSSLLNYIHHGNLKTAMASPQPIPCLFPLDPAAYHPVVKRPSLTGSKGTGPVACTAQIWRFLSSIIVLTV